MNVWRFSLQVSLNLCIILSYRPPVHMYMSLFNGSLSLLVYGSFLLVSFEMSIWVSFLGLFFAYTRRRLLVLKTSMIYRFFRSKSPIEYTHMLT